MIEVNVEDNVPGRSGLCVVARRDGIQIASVGNWANRGQAEEIADFSRRLLAAAEKPYALMEKV